MTPQLTVRAAPLTLPFLCFKTSICFLKTPLQRGFDLYQPLWHATGTRWWLSRRPPWLTPVHQTTAITPSTPPRHTSCCCLQPSLVAPPEATIWHSGSFINASSSIRRLRRLNNWTSAGENENKKFNSFLLTHSTLVIFQTSFSLQGSKSIPVAACETPCSDLSQLLINFLFLVPFSGMSYKYPENQDYLQVEYHCPDQHFLITM